MSMYHELFNVSHSSIQDLLDRMKIEPIGFKSKHVLITGGARGIGEQLAIGLAYLGCKVTIIDKLSKGKEVVNKINSLGGEAAFILQDISESVYFEKSLKASVKNYGRIDILLNNAVHFQIKDFKDLSIKEWDLHYKTNITATFIASKFVLPDMIANKSGTIVNMVALEGMSYASAMSSSKVAMRSLLISLASELGDDNGVNVMGFAPGLVSTPLIEDVWPKYCEKIKIDFRDYIKFNTNNPGYPGLMPVEDCAAGLIYNLAHANLFHGLIADPFIPLEKTGIISIKEEDIITDISKDLIDNKKAINSYIHEIIAFNKRVENKIKIKTSEITEEKNIVEGLLEQLFQKSEDLSVINDELLESNENLDRFAHTVSHDLKAPLKAIATIVSFLEEDLEGKLEEGTFDLFSKLKSRVVRLDKLINGILKYSEIKQTSILYEDIDLNILLKEISFDLNPINAVEINIQDEIPTIKGCLTRITQVFQNLLSNGIKYNDKELPVISISCEVLSEKFKFKVEDNGPGIEEKYHIKVFGFLKSFNTNKDIDSTGIGLSIVKKIVNEAEGEIWVESDGKSGSAFLFTIPKNKLSL